MFPDGRERGVERFWSDWRGGSCRMIVISEETRKARIGERSKWAGTLPTLTQAGKKGSLC